MQRLWMITVVLLLGACVQQNGAENEKISLLRKIKNLATRELMDLVMKDTRAILCHEDEVACDAKGAGKCISRAQFCDGKIDCPGGTDEKLCDLLCGPSGVYGKLSAAEWKKGYYCEAEHKCLTEAQKCDSNVDCPKDPLENNASGRAKFKCNNKRENVLRELLNAFASEQK